jgi:hypothetical protein
MSYLVLSLVPRKLLALVELFGYKGDGALKLGGGEMGVEPLIKVSFSDSLLVFEVGCLVSSK